MARRLQAVDEGVPRCEVVVARPSCLACARWHSDPAVIGAILTGYLDEGTADLMAVKQCGGTTVIQDQPTPKRPRCLQVRLAMCRSIIRSQWETWHRS